MTNEVRLHRNKMTREWNLRNRVKQNATHRKYIQKVPEKATFIRIKQRCNNPNNPDFRLYGGRGIKCLLISEQDIISSIGHKPGLRWSIDRIDNNGHYEIGNIRWATAKEQRANQRRQI